MRLAAFQFPISGDVAENNSTISSAIYVAAEKGCRLVIFPECALTGYPPRNIPASPSVDMGAVELSLKKLGQAVRETGTTALLGSIARENGAFYNRAYLLRPDGDIQYYDKRALWGWDRDNFAAGTGGGVFTVSGLKIGVRICFEVRFPEYFRELYREKTDLNIVLFYDVSDTDDISRYEIIRSCLITRAVENVCPTLSVNTAAPFETAPTCLIGPSGDILAELERGRRGMIIYDFAIGSPNFGERGRMEISDGLLEGR